MAVRESKRTFPWNPAPLATLESPSQGFRIFPRWPSRRHALCRVQDSPASMTPRQKLYLALPLIAVAVIVLVYFQLFSSPIVIAILFVAYVTVSLLNRRKFARQRAESGKST
jgi:Flp pilus assembly protein TadB